jgi:enoyl-CoA hydratase/carnithine racemase
LTEAAPGAGPLTVERRGTVLCLGLNRVAKRNAFDVDLYSALSAALGAADRDPEVRCTLLFAHGEHFTGGIDLPQWMPHFREGHPAPLPEGGLDPCGLDPGRTRTKPLVMAVQGYCYTLGIELLLAADVRVASDSTRFAQIEVARGIYPIGGASIRLVQEAGWGNAMRWLLTGETFDAAEALRIGLVQSVVPHGQQFDAALRIAETIAAQAPLAVLATLRSARLQRDPAEAAAIARLLPDMLPLLASDDAREGLRAILERRPGRFTGR